MIHYFLVSQREQHLTAYRHRIYELFSRSYESWGKIGEGMVRRKIPSKSSAVWRRWRQYSKNWVGNGCIESWRRASRLPEVCTMKERGCYWAWTWAYGRLALTMATPVWSRQVTALSHFPQAVPQTLFLDKISKIFILALLTSGDVGTEEREVTVLRMEWNRIHSV